MGGRNRRHSRTRVGVGGRENIRNAVLKPRSDFLFTKHALFLGLEGPPHFRWDTLGCRKVRIFHFTHFTDCLLRIGSGCAAESSVNSVFFVAWLADFTRRRRMLFFTRESKIFHSLVAHEFRRRVVESSSSVDYTDDDERRDMVEGSTKSLHFN